MLFATCARRWVRRKVYLRRIAAARAASSAVQGCWRQCVARAVLLDLKVRAMKRRHAAGRIQRRLRVYLVLLKRLRDAREFREQTRAALLVQRAARGRKGRRIANALRALRARSRANWCVLAVGAWELWYEALEARSASLLARAYRASSRRRTYTRRDRAARLITRKLILGYVASRMRRRVAAKHAVRHASQVKIKGAWREMKQRRVAVVFIAMIAPLKHLRHVEVVKRVTDAQRKYRASRQCKAARAVLRRKRLERTAARTLQRYARGRLGRDERRRREAAAARAAANWEAVVTTALAFSAMDELSRTAQRLQRWAKVRIDRMARKRRHLAFRYRCAQIVQTAWRGLYQRLEYVGVGRAVLLYCCAACWCFCCYYGSATTATTTTTTTTDSLMHPASRRYKAFLFERYSNAARVIQAMWRSREFQLGVQDLVAEAQVRRGRAGGATGRGRPLSMTSRAER